MQLLHDELRRRALPGGLLFVLALLGLWRVGWRIRMCQCRLEHLNGRIAMRMCDRHMLQYGPSSARRSMIGLGFVDGLLRRCNVSQAEILRRGLLK